MADVPAAMRPAFVAYLNRKYATCVPKTVSSVATRLAHFGRYLAAADPTLTSLSQLDAAHRAVHHVADHRNQQRHR